jgi:hypothetical protein
MRDLRSDVWALQIHKLIQEGSIVNSNEQLSN